ncbi:hypothetical protein tloyanaT_20490 [Thalassotalea loyana]|uniref:TonB-dependent receptor n=1 Tax=Thalassotalea loyana TaxID=280483 RepID=A0ABQ6HCG6_9GAMM|nr:TonB-dependent receptor [Thalassotalea loyana]GLX85797.1 hypothetical protein tloyanaT_20490 [Thalassotalea loyana]
MRTNLMSSMGKKSTIALAVVSALTGFNAVADEANTAKEKETEVIEVRGIRDSLKQAMFDKKESVSVYDGIAAEDLGKFPDQNVAESLQRITGVSIDRSSGEGRYVSVRGFGPAFNTVLVNGRQMATENQGREFSFDTLPAEMITGAEVYKSPTASMQEGALGATINVNTARPFMFDGFKAAASVKGTYDDTSEATSPQISGLVSDIFMDGKLGALLSLSHQERESTENIVESRYYRTGVNFTTPNGKEFTNANVPQNFDLIVDEQERERQSATAVIQYAPNEDLILTFDGLYTKLEVKSDANSLGHWFSDGNFLDAEVDDNNTVVYIENSASGATDFIHRTYDRNVDITAFGFNADWQINSDLSATFDFSTSTAEENSGGDIFFNVIGYNNAYTWDNRDGGDYPTISIEGGTEAALDAARGRAHYNDRSGWDIKDEITELRADFVWETGQDTFTQMKFGAYYQDRKKDNERKFVSDCSFYCGYGVDVPDNLLVPFTADGFYSGLPNTWLTYDQAAYDAFRAEYMAAQDPDTAAAYAALGYDDPQRALDSFIVEEELLSAYVEFIFEGEIGDMAWLADVGIRYTQTDAVLSGFTAELVDLTPIPNDPSDLNEVYANDGEVTQVDADNDYTNLLPSFNLRLNLTEDMVLRFAYSETLTRPTLTDLNPALTITSSRPNNNSATGGNPELKPFYSKNWDLSYEWYYSDASNFTAAVFSKEVDDFITSTVETEQFNLISGAFDFDVRRPRNGEEATVNGLELAWTHALENGFGFQVNATWVDSEASLAGDSTDTFALEGLGDSRNFIAFYDKDGIQARIAYNFRDDFMQNVIGPYGGTEPMFTEAYGQWDISASYDIDENFTVFLEGVNVTGEEIRRHGRYTNQFIRYEGVGARYSVGVRANF